MSKNLTRKGLALGTALAFVVTGFTGIAPASAAAGDVVKLAPTVGTGYGAYNSDYLNINASIDTDVVTSAAYDKLAIQLDHTESDGGSTVTVKLNDGLAAGSYTATKCTYSLPIKMTSSSGVVTTDTLTNDVTSGVSSAQDCTEATGAKAIFTVPFDDSTVNKVVLDLVGIESAAKVKLSLNATDAAQTVHENEAVAVTAWIDSDEDEVQEDTDKFPSKVETATFYDAKNVTVTPRIERFIDSTGVAYLNARTTNKVSGSLSFSPQLNLDQIAIRASSNWEFASSLDTSIDEFVPQYEKGKTSLSASGKIFGVFTDDEGQLSANGDSANGFSSTTNDWNTAPSTDNIDNIGSAAFTVTAKRKYATAAGSSSELASYVTAGFTAPIQAADVVKAATATADLTDDFLQASTATQTISLRSGVSTFKYTMTSKGAGAAALAADAVSSNVPVIAIVTASALATGGSLTVGSTKLAKGEAAMISGVTDANGKFSVSVTSALAKADESYTVDFRVLQYNGTWVSSTASTTAGTIYTATYAAAAATTFAQSSAILSGSTVTAKFTLKDQFGKAVSANASGTAYTVALKANDTTKLKKYATIVNGAASIEFANYLAKGQSDTLTAELGTGLDTLFDDHATIADLSPVLYNPEDAAGVSTAATATGEVNYQDFITGTANTTTNVAPTTSAIQLSGTVVDASGVGIPGAVVTVAAKGLQFVKTNGGTATGDYYQDTITVSADAAGAYEVKAWTHALKTAGVTITTTSGGKSASTVLKSYLPTALDGNNLQFALKLPNFIVKNSTYAISAKLTDKWGNPIATSTNGSNAGVTFTGVGSVEINSSATAVAKNFDSTGTAVVFVRSIKDIAGPGAITATLGTAYYKKTSGAVNQALVIDEITTDVTGTKWDETVFKNSTSVDVDVLNAAPKATITKAATSSAIVKNVSGHTVKIVRGTKSTTKVATSNSFKITVKGGTGTVKVYVDGILISSKK